jgi:hypothetical protein
MFVGCLKEKEEEMKELMKVGKEKGREQLVSLLLAVLDN